MGLLDGKKLLITGVLMESSIAFQAAREAQQEGQLGMRAILVEVLRAGQRSGEFPHTDPVEDARAVHSVVSGLVEARLAGIPGPTRVAARDHTVDLVLRARGAPVHQRRRSAEPVRTRFSER